MALTLDAQLLICDQESVAAFDDFVDFIWAHREQIIAGARVGFIAGYEKYRDSTWEKSAQELDEDTYEEARDAVAYQVIKRWRSRRPFPVVLPEPSEAPDD